MREVTSGGSFGSNGFMQHIGLGRAHRIETLEIYWPASGTRQTFRDVPANRVLEIREGADTFAERQQPRIPLGGPTQ